MNKSINKVKREKLRIEFAIKFLEPGENSEQNGNVQIFKLKLRNF